MSFVPALLSFVLCLALTPLVKFAAVRRGWMAYPRKDRWHQTPTALLGGIAIYSGMSTALLLIIDCGALPRSLGGRAFLHPSLLAAVLWAGMTFLFVLGLLDDFVNFKPHTKLVGQILTASLVSLVGFRLHWFTSLTLDTMFTIVWIVGITNAFNLLDNMDGLCAGIGCVAAVSLAAVFWPAQPQAAVMCLSLAGALLAFLVYNFNPASIFMGDCGSMPIGFCLAVLSLFYSETASRNLMASLAVPILVMLVPVLDTSLVTFIRLLSGRGAFAGGRDHTSHRLVLMGLSERSAVLFLYLIGAVSGLAARFVSTSDTLTSPTVIIPILAAVILMAIYLAQLRVYPEKEFSVLRDRTFTPVLIELTYKRQLVMVILDLGLVAFAYYLSYRLRFAGGEFVVFFKVFLRSLPAVIACKLAAFFVIGAYRGIWGYMSSNDVMVYIKASTVGSLLSIVTVTYLFRFEHFSKGIFVIDWLLTTAALLGSRGFFRLTSDFMKRKTLGGERVLIYGAGRGGEILLREVLNNRRLAVEPVGFIDDDPVKTGKKLQGFPVLGTSGDLEALVEKHRVSGLVISVADMPAERLEKLRRFCRRREIHLKRFRITLEDLDTIA